MNDKIKTLESSEENMLSRLSECEEKLEQQSIIVENDRIEEVIREQKILSEKLGHQAERIDRILPISKRSRNSYTNFWQSSFPKKWRFRLSDHKRALEEV